MRWLQSKETTFYMDDMKLQERWQYYISSYLSPEPTEGVDREKLSRVMVHRNIPTNENESDDGNVLKSSSVDENLTVNICIRSSKMVWDAGAWEKFLSNAGPATQQEKEEREHKRDSASASRAWKLRERFIMNSSWMRDLSQEDVEKKKADYTKWADGAVDLQGEGRDVEMSG